MFAPSFQNPTFPDTVFTQSASNTNFLPDNRLPLTAHIAFVEAHPDMNSIISRLPVNASDSSTACAHCAEAADEIKCEDCNNARYCSEECQVADR